MLRTVKLAVDWRPNPGVCVAFNTVLLSFRLVSCHWIEAANTSPSELLTQSSRKHALKVLCLVRAKSGSYFHWMGNNWIQDWQDGGPQQQRKLRCRLKHYTHHTGCYHCGLVHRGPKESKMLYRTHHVKGHLAHIFFFFLRNWGELSFFSLRVCLWVGYVCRNLGSTSGVLLFTVLYFDSGPLAELEAHRLGWAFRPLESGTLLP